MEMEEFVFDRNTNVTDKTEVELTFENADIGWGFRVKQQSSNAMEEVRGKIKATVELEEVKEPTLQNLNISMR